MRRLAILAAVVALVGAFMAPAASAVPNGPNSFNVDFDCSHYGPFFTAEIPNLGNLAKTAWVVTSPVTVIDTSHLPYSEVQSVAHSFEPTYVRLFDETTGAHVEFQRPIGSLTNVTGGQRLDCSVGVDTAVQPATFVGPNGDTYASFIVVSGVLH